MKKISLLLSFFFASCFAFGQCDNVATLKNTEWTLVQYTIGEDSAVFSATDKKAVIKFYADFTLDFRIGNTLCTGRYQTHPKRCFDMKLDEKCKERLNPGLYKSDYCGTFTNGLFMTHHVSISEEKLIFYDGYDGCRYEFVFVKIR